MYEYGYLDMFALQNVKIMHWESIAQHEMEYLKFLSDITFNFLGK